MSEDFGPEPIVINFKDGFWTIETYSSFGCFSDGRGGPGDRLFAYGEGETLDEAISNFEKSLENTLMDN